eukprot:CAMPEP_0119109422 /NCGR_PEP_ID=MMETSP1180-20130426/17901_1 /TAXON_ID=3052 ORGANISM="Chlamydomonas cf sp, Strain CCMP681" /NCGR_SAMPLE_ID=MMETSP1180 /ASSEMBLY_ACC=CAM_ASM_000741 /LENGTH=397 /DNA_ID=CAMNT_0007095177 /DNA_START=92 /DNA_END=1285 /DNA_ORIENTATION=+
MSGGAGWLQGYLAPLNVLTHQQTQPQLGQLADSKHQHQQLLQPGLKRPAFQDISNSDVVPRGQQDKGKHGPGARTQSREVNTAPVQLLSQGQFTDPNLIDNAYHTVERRKRPDRDWYDVDAANVDDPQACGPYAAAIFSHLRQTETQRRPKPTYLEAVQHDMNAKMRAILVDWLVEVAEEYKLCADTLYLTINFIDRFLSVHIVQRSHLQLVGVACMWVAAKYEEVHPPNVADFCYITDNTYSKEQMVLMEETVLKQLKYELTVPTAKTFLRRMLQVCNPDELLHFLSNYLTELSLLDHNMLNYLPSEIAAAAVCLANLMLRRAAWDCNLQHYSTYTVQDISNCVYSLATLHQAVTGNSQLAAIRDKYGHQRFQAVSKMMISASLVQQLKSSCDSSG